MILSVETIETVRADASVLESTYYAVGGAHLAPDNICITKGSCCCSCSSQTPPQ